jgi:hypothetical protein
MRYSCNKEAYGYGSSYDYPGPVTLSGAPDMRYSSNREAYGCDSSFDYSSPATFSGEADYSHELNSLTNAIDRIAERVKLLDAQGEQHPEPKLASYPSAAGKVSQEPYARQNESQSRNSSNETPPHPPADFSVKVTQVTPKREIPYIDDDQEVRKRRQIEQRNHTYAAPTHYVTSNDNDCAAICGKVTAGILVVALIIGAIFSKV